MLGMVKEEMSKAGAGTLDGPWRKKYLAVQLLSLVHSYCRSSSSGLSKKMKLLKDLVLSFGTYIDPECEKQVNAGMHNGVVRHMAQCMLADIQGGEAVSVA
eukprot:gene19001-6338_t